MESVHLKEIEGILEAIRVISPDRFVCADREIETKPGELLKGLQDFLYTNCYLQPFTGSVAARASRNDPGDDLTEEFRNSRSWRACRDCGWRIDQVLESGHIVAKKSGAARRFGPGHYLVMESQSTAPKKDQEIAVCLPRGSDTAQEGYYFAYGETVNEYEESYNLLRFYWNIAAKGAPRLLATMTETLDRFQVSFQFKLFRKTDAYYRRDSAVLYVNKKYFRIVAMLAERVHVAVREHLREGSPLFTKSLAFGLSFAEDPGESFGVHRTRIFAQALWSMYERKIETNRERFAELDRQFQEHRLLLDQPHLSPGSRDDHPFGNHTSATAS